MKNFEALQLKSGLATAKEGFDRDILLTNEEALGYVYRQEASWPPPSGDPTSSQIGLVVALDIRTGKEHPIYGMGRHNHENSVPVPGFEDLVVLSGDDTFTSGPLTGVSLPGVVPAQIPNCIRTLRQIPTHCWLTKATCGPSFLTRRGSRTIMM